MFKNIVYNMPVFKSALPASLQTNASINIDRKIDIDFCFFRYK